MAPFWVKLSRRAISIAVGAFFATTALGALYAWNMAQVILESIALSGTIGMSEVLDAARTIYTRDVVERVTPQGIAVTHDFAKDEAAIPLPISFVAEIGKLINAGTRHSSATIYSAYPFSFRKDRMLDAFQKDALATLGKNPKKGFYRIERVNGALSLRYARADVMRPACIRCHNSHPDSPKKDWQVGDVRGVLEVVQPLEAIAQKSQAAFTEFLTIFLSSAILASAIVVISILAVRRTNHILNKAVVDLRETQRQLERSNRELEEFAAVAAHDLRSPIVSTLSWLDMLKADSGSQISRDSKQALSIIEENTRKSERLIHDLLEFARLNREAVDGEKVEVERVVAHVLLEFKDEIKANGAQVNVGPLPAVIATPSQIESLFGNLIRNALTYREKTRPLEISIGYRDVGKLYEFYVKDNGIGIAPGDTEKVFAMFKRLHSHDDYKGSGIGLAHCKKVVEVLGGKIWVTPTPGHGSTFFFTVPKPE